MGPEASGRSGIVWKDVFQGQKLTKHGDKEEEGDIPVKSLIKWYFLFIYLSFIYI